MKICEGRHRGSVGEFSVLRPTKLSSLVEVSKPAVDIVERTTNFSPVCLPHLRIWTHACPTLCP
jgi:hypothetical protein